MFILKKSEKLRLCINYRQLNSIIKKKYPLLLISKIQDRIGNTQIFIKIDLKWVYRGDGVVVEMHCQEVQSGVVPVKVVGLNPTALFLSCGFLFST